MIVAPEQQAIIPEQKDPPSGWKAGPGLRFSVSQRLCGRFLCASQPVQTFTTGFQKSNVTDTFVSRGEMTEVGASHVAYVALAPLIVDLLKML